MNWMLYGRPSDEKPHGKQIAGTPARSIGIVNSALRGERRGPRLVILRQRADLNGVRDRPCRIAA